MLKFPIHSVWHFFSKAWYSHETHPDSEQQFLDHTIVSCGIWTHKTVSEKQRRSDWLNNYANRAVNDNCLNLYISLVKIIILLWLNVDRGIDRSNESLFIQNIWWYRTVNIFAQQFFLYIVKILSKFYKFIAKLKKIPVEYKNPPSF